MYIFKKGLTFILSFITSIIILNGQNLPIGGWQAHLPFNKARLVTQAGSKIFCGAEDGIFSVNMADNSLESFTKVNGLSDIDLSVLRYYPLKDILFIGYENGNIDLMKENTFYNISDIKRKSIIGSKKINNVLFFNNLAYLSCPFGIVVVDLDKREIKDTYYLTSSGSANAIYGLASDGNNLFAASDSGVFAININDPTINFFGSWNKIRDKDTQGWKYTQITWFNNKLYVLDRLQNGNSDVKYYDNGSWLSPPPPGINFYAIQSMQVCGNKLVVAGLSDVRVYDGSIQMVFSFNNLPTFFQIRDAIFDNNTAWIADNEEGLIKAASSSSYELIFPDGPTSSKATTIKISNGQLWVGHSGYRSNRWDAIFSNDGFSTYANGDWKTYNRKNVSSPLVSLDTVKDFMSIAIDPRNSNHIFLGSRGKGIVEFENGQVKNYFNEFNSTIQTYPGFQGLYWIGEMAFDNDYNLWIVNSSVPAPLLTYKTDGTWQAAAFSGIQTSGVLLGEMILDSYGMFWINRLQSGILFANGQGVSGDIPSNDVRCFTEDKDGQVWVGTTKGVAVAYGPGSEFQKILVLQDGTYQYLLETEVVTSIAVDGANRKWFGTENSGVFLLSEDGTNQVLHFTTSNSPLLSNKIYTIAIDDKTGIVFFGTDRGIISYKSDAIEGKDFCENTYTYPNPVRPGYEGPIAITGLVSNGNVKITDVSGTLVYETTALGGQAIWNGRNFNGEKAHTGVYLVFCTDTEGQNTCITKILFIN